MDEISAGWCRELFKISRMDPGGGRPVLERVEFLCSHLSERHGSSELVAPLPIIRLLLQEWTEVDGWKAYGPTPEALRDKIIERLGTLTVSSCFRDDTAEPKDFQDSPLF